MAAADSATAQRSSESEARLRHEFVGMMFAVTIGEVGLQVAPLVQHGDALHWLPAYSHIFLATFVIATSWVGWSLSVSPGARKDVTGVFQLEFVFLLLDVAMVITYFILVRTVDFADDSMPHVGSGEEVARWFIVIFGLYLAWDFVTKVLIYVRDRNAKSSWAPEGARMVPTVVCFAFTLLVWQQAGMADDVHRMTVDLALLSLVLLFRALKDLASALMPRDDQASRGIRRRSSRVIVGAVVIFAIGFAYGTGATRYSWRVPLPHYMIRAVQTP